MSITYNLNIPDGPNDPSDDQPLMKQNTNAIDTWVNVDHIKFAAGGSNTAGYHKQVTFNNKNVAGAVTDPVSILYTDDGSESSVSQLLYRNQNAILPISLIRAYIVLNPATSTTLNSYNATVTAYGVSTIIQLTANCTTGDDVGVIMGSSLGGGGPAYTFADPNLTLNFVSSAPNIILTVLVLQF